MKSPKPHFLRFPFCATTQFPGFLVDLFLFRSVLKRFRVFNLFDKSEQPIRPAPYFPLVLFLRKTPNLMHERKLPWYLPGSDSPASFAQALNRSKLSW